MRSACNKIVKPTPTVRRCILLFKERRTLKIHNEQHHLLDVNSVDHNDIRSELRTKRDEPIPPFIANQSSHRVIMCDIVSVGKICRLAIGLWIRVEAIVVSRGLHEL